MSTSKPAGSGSDPEEIAGRYAVERKLGAGAFGTVYKAKDKLLGRMIAIKTIRLEGLAASAQSLDELLTRFRREAMVSAQLKHPNIVTIYDIGESQGMSYLAMEFIDGVGLEKVIRDTGPFPIERAASIAAQVADALDYAHRQNVVHRDIKPANVMIEPGDRVKVADFGIARVTNSADHLTATGSLLGTPSYMSPEQARGNELDGRSDLFSLGCVLYEMLAGRRAFRGESITGLIFKVITEDPPALADLRPTIPPELVLLVARAMAKQPAARFQSGREMADALVAFTGAGATPTIRQAETPTESMPPAPTLALPAEQTASALPTAAVPATISGAPTRVASASPPPPRAAASAKPASRPSAPAAAAPAATSTGSRRAGLKPAALLAIGGGGLLALAALAGAGWYFTAGPGARRADVTTPPTVASIGPGPAAPGTNPSAAPTPAESVPPAAVPPATTSPPPTQAPSVTVARDEAPTPAQPARPASGEPAQPAPAPHRAERPAPAESYSFLDDEQQRPDDRVARGLPEGYRGGSSYPSGRRLTARDRSPMGVGPLEKPAVATLRHLMNAQEAYYQQHSRYASLAELLRDRFAALDVAQSRDSFTRRGYRFSMTIEEDGFTIRALPVERGPRPFVGDDTGFIRVGTE
ncbi:MAG: protein kinase [Vicinamibacteria bacterium]